MLFTRSDYNNRIIDRENKIPKDEPVFLLRGQDKFASQTLKKYCELLEEEANLLNNSELIEMAQELRLHAKAMLLWKYSKAPDKPKVTKMSKKNKDRIHNLINFSVLARELNEKGQSVNVKNFFPSRIGKKYQPVLDLLETRLQEFLDEFDKLQWEKDAKK